MAAEAKSGGGGGPTGDSDARVVRLEAHMEHVRSDLSVLRDVPVQIATLTERVAHLPSKGFVVTAATGTVAGIAGLLVLLQQIGILH